MDDEQSHKKEESQRKPFLLDSVKQSAEYRTLQSMLEGIKKYSDAIEKNQNSDRAPRALISYK